MFFDRLKLSKRMTSCLTSADHFLFFINQGPAVVNKMKTDCTISNVPMVYEKGHHRFFGQKILKLSSGKWHKLCFNNSIL